jgi:hypothetical protein
MDLNDHKQWLVNLVHTTSLVAQALDFDFMAELHGLR